MDELGASRARRRRRARRREQEGPAATRHGERPANHCDSRAKTSHWRCRDAAQLTRMKQAGLHRCRAATGSGCDLARGRLEPQSRLSTATVGGAREAAQMLDRALHRREREACAFAAFFRLRVGRCRLCRQLRWARRRRLRALFDEVLFEGALGEIDLRGCVLDVALALEGRQLRRDKWGRRRLLLFAWPRLCDAVEQGSLGFLLGWATTSTHQRPPQKYQGQV